MAHNLNYNDRTGKYSFFSVQEKAWHGLGQIVSEYPTSQQAIVAAGLDYNVVKTPLLTKGQILHYNEQGLETESEEIEVENYFANLRTDNNTVLGVVGKDYQIVQNRDAFGFFDAIVGGDKGILYETAGALGTITIFTQSLQMLCVTGSNHNLRMPIMLKKKEDEKRWLDGENRLNFAWPGYDSGLIAFPIKK